MGKYLLLLMSFFILSGAATQDKLDIKLANQSSAALNQEKMQHQAKQSWIELTDQAVNLYREKRYEEAAGVIKKALKIAEQDYGPESLQIAQSLAELATLYRIEGRVIESERLMKKAEAICAKYGRRGAGFLGIQTEALLDELLNESEGVPPGRIRMGGRLKYKLCDLNWDGVCDTTDLAIFKASLGKCWEKDDGYNLRADINADGCVTPEDQIGLFPDDLEK